MAGERRGASGIARIINQRQTDKTKVLFVDIETSPLLAWVWSLHGEQNISPTSQLERDWNLLSWAASWGTDPHNVFGRSLKDDRRRKRVSHDDWWRDDYYLARDLGELFTEADIIVAHNGDRFDIRKVNSRLVTHGLPAPTPYKTIDTLKVSRARFAHTSHRLVYLAELLGFDGKIDTDFSLWDRCVHGDARAFEEMLEYNLQDVVVLYNCYLRLRPWAKNPPNLSAISGSGAGHCPSCDAKLKSTQPWDGWHVTKTRKYPVLRCHVCKAQSRSVCAEPPERIRDTVLVPL
jgi:hypothetical protein